MHNITDVFQKDKCMIKLRISINFLYANWPTEEGTIILIIYLIFLQHLCLYDWNFYGLDYDVNKGTISLNSVVQWFKMHWNLLSMSIIYVILPRIQRSKKSYMRFILNVVFISMFAAAHNLIFTRQININLWFRFIGSKMIKWTQLGWNQSFISA